MDLLEPNLADVIPNLQDTRIRGLFSGLGAGLTPVVGARTYVIGEVLTFGDDWIDLWALWFTPSAGFVASEEQAKVTVAFPDVGNRCLHLCKGIQVICSGVRALRDDDTVALREARIAFRRVDSIDAAGHHAPLLRRFLWLAPGFTMDGQSSQTILCRTGAVCRP